MKLLKNLAAILLMILIYSCEAERKEIIDYEELDFTTNDASEIYFKNVRQSEYKLTELRHEGFNLFEPRNVNSLEFVKLKILHNWRTDRAYFGLFEETDVSIKVIIGRDTLSQVQEDFMSQTHLAREIYNGILLKDSIFIKADRGEFQRMFFSQTEREAFRIMYFDYLRLIDVK